LPAIAVRIFAEVSPMPAVNEAVYALHSWHSGDQPHRQPVKRGKSQGAFDAARLIDRAHRGSPAEMGDDD
jgi:hypothetical protein